MATARSNRNLERKPPREPDKAFVAAFSGAYIGSFLARLGEEPEGVEFDVETDAMLFDRFSIEDLNTRYTTISGSARTTATSVAGEFILTGGPIAALSFEMTVEQMRAETIEATVTANGREVTISVEAGAADYLRER